MKCYVCSKKAKINQQKGRFICDNCFSKQFEKRVRKFTRINKIFSANSKVLVIGYVNKFLSSSIVGKLPVSLTFRKKLDEGKVKNFDKVLVEWTLDDEANDFLLNLFNGVPRKKFKSKYVKLLVNSTNDDVLNFARINKLKFKIGKIDVFVQKLIDDLHKEHSSAKYTLLKNINVLDKLTKKSK